MKHVVRVSYTSEVRYYMDVEVDTEEADGHHIKNMALNYVRARCDIGHEPTWMVAPNFPGGRRLRHFTAAMLTTPIRDSDNDDSAASIDEEITF